MDISAVLIWVLYTIWILCLAYLVYGLGKMHLENAQITDIFEGKIGQMIYIKTEKGKQIGPIHTNVKRYNIGDHVKIESNKWGLFNQIISPDKYF